MFLKEKRFKAKIRRKNMEIIRDAELINYYIKKYKIDEFFTDPSICKQMVIRQYHKGEYIISPEGVVEQMNFVLEGRAKVYSVSNNGKILLLSFYKPFSIFGDVEYALKKETDYIAESLGTSRCLSIDLDCLKEHTKFDVKFKDFMLASIAKKLNQSASKNMFNLLYPLENRIAGYIMSISMEEEEDFVEIFNLKDAAFFLGSSYRHLIRVLDKLEEKGIIRRERKKIYILDKKALEILAEELYEWE